MEPMTLIQLHKKHIRGTEEKAIVSNVTVFLCNLTIAVKEGLKCDENKIYITSRALKHLYDKKPAEEYDSTLNGMVEITKYPDRIYENKGGKRGCYCFVKKINNINYLVSLESSTAEPAGMYVVTAFRVRDEKYLESYKLIWSWESGISPS